MKKSLIVLAIASALSFPAFAAWTLLYAGTVSQAANGDVYIYPATGTTVAGCSNNDFYVVKAATIAKQALAVSMFAKSQGLQIGINVSGCDATIARPIGTDIQLP